MWWTCLALLLISSGCGPAPQRDSIRTVAAYEVPLPTAGERREFLALLDAEARAHGFHVDADSDADLAERAAAIPQAEMTIHAAVWGDADDRNPEAGVMDLPGYLGRPWLDFARGVDPGRSTRFRDAVMRKVRARWPETLSLPVLPGGSLPQAEDLRRTPQGYRLDPGAAERYGLSPSSPLVAPR